MAMARSAVAHLFFLLLLVSTAPAVRTTPDSATAAAAATAGGRGSTIQEACNRTLFPKVCLSALKDNPECQSGAAITPRRLAELLVYVSAEVGMTVAAFAHHELNAIRDDTLYKCLDTCSEDIEEAVAHLSALSRDFTDAKFLEVKSWLSATLGGTSTCEDACKDAPVSDVKNACVTKSFEFEKLLRVTLDLITEASGAMSAEVALPPAVKAGGAAAGAPAAYAGGAPAPAGGGYGAAAGAPAAYSGGGGAPSPSRAAAPAAYGGAKKGSPAPAPAPGKAAAAADA